MSFPAEILDKLFCSYEPEPHVVGLLELERYKKKGTGKNMLLRPFEDENHEKIFKKFLKRAEEFSQIKMIR